MKKRGKKRGEKTEEKTYNKTNRTVTKSEPENRQQDSGKFNCSFVSLHLIWFVRFNEFISIIDLVAVVE